ncbi:MAG: hypothetical protein DRP50_08430 [Thermotoga sp.]|nr:MAG: hypothetical protein DRP50_08430 [Thermotoga sp.]
MLDTDAKILIAYYLWAIFTFGLIRHLLTVRQMSFKDIGLRWDKPPGDLAWASLTFIILTFINALLISLLKPTGFSYPYLPMKVRLSVPLWVYITLIGPIVEEITFRGFLYNLCKHYLHPGISNLIVSAIFALFHPTKVFVYIFIFSLGITLLYEKRKSLVAAVFVHIFQNTMASILYSVR